MDAPSPTSFMAPCPRCRRPVKMDYSHDGGRSGFCINCHTVVTGPRADDPPQPVPRPAPPRPAGTPASQLSPTPSPERPVGLGPERSFNLWCKSGSHTEPVAWSFAQETKYTTYFEASTVWLRAPAARGEHVVNVVCPRCKKTVDCTLEVLDQVARRREAALGTVMVSALCTIIGLAMQADNPSILRRVLGLGLLVLAVVVPFAAYKIAGRFVGDGITYRIGAASRVKEQDKWHKLSEP